MAELLGKYRLLELLATGGMGEVFLAELVGPAGYTKRVVVKRILRHLARQQDFLELFLNEARLAALLDHPNIVQIFELGECEGSYFIAMEYVPGLTLAQLHRQLALEGRRIPAPLAVLACIQALEGLGHAHAKADPQGRPLGLVHRDVSPDNLLVRDDGLVKLTDFGIAKATALTATTQGVVRGKYAYSAPEQLRATGVDARADLYSLGAVLYELLSGHKPFEAASDSALLEKALTEPARPLRELVPETPEALSAIVERALQKRPEARFPDAAQMKAALEHSLSSLASRHELAELGTLVRQQRSRVAPHAALVSGTAVDAEPPLPPGRTAGPSRSRRAAVLVGTLASLAIAAGAWGAWRLTSSDGTEHAGPRPTPPAPEAARPVLHAPVAQSLDAGTPASPAAASAVTPAVATGPKRVKPKSAPKPASLAPGWVVVRVYPWAEVLVDGKKLGVTPMPPINLPAGRHELTLKNPELAVEKRLTVRVAPNETVAVETDLMKR